MIPEPSERTVRIPVQWIDGHWQLMGGGKLPALTPNACAHLMLPSIFLANDEQRQRWVQEGDVDFLQAGTELFARVNLNNVPMDLRGKAEEKEHNTGVPSLFVKIVLQKDASLALTLGKRGRLVGGECMIPSLKDQAQSINEAYTKIIRVFEPNRRSDSGNVFSVVFIELGQRLVKLGTLREEATNVAAMRSARPRDRCETWRELATTLSRVQEVWTRFRDSFGDRQFQELSSVGRKTIPLPSQSTDAIKQTGEAYYDFRYELMFRRREGLLAIFTQFHDPAEKSAEIETLRELRDAMDRVVLEAYGWDDLAAGARCEFLRDEGHEDNKNESGRRSSSSQAEKEDPWRLRWPDDFRDEVLARLLKLDEQRAKEEVLAGKGYSTGQRNLFERDN